MTLKSVFRRFTARRSVSALDYVGLSPHLARDIGLIEPEISRPAIRRPF